MLQDLETCLHLLSMCMNTTLNNIQTTLHSKVVWQIHKLLLSHCITRNTFLYIERMHLSGCPLKDTIPTWPCPCLCTTKTMPIPCHTQTWHPYHHHDLPEESHKRYHPKLERTIHFNVHIMP